MRPKSMLLLARFTRANLLLLTWIALTALCRPVRAEDDLNALFLGDNGPHHPAQLYQHLQPVLANRGIHLTYTDKPGDLNSSNLAKYQVLLLYANIEKIAPDQEKSLLEFVDRGGGFVPLHCASFCFQNSDACIRLIGAQFDKHGWARMRETVENKEHAVTHGYDGFESLDETYIHRKHNDEGRIVLSYRVEGNRREPWTWVREQGKGRVFYTAWGHDQHTWSNPGFQNLIERGIRWAAHRDPAAAGEFHAREPFVAPKMTKLPTAKSPFEYVDVGAKIPVYPRSDKWGEQAKPEHMMQKPLPPAKSIERMVVPEGFHVELFAAEPDIQGKPICMTWDERGRLWICETVDYPNELQPENSGRDRIRICEDTDGDGRADKFTVFAEKLSIPTSIAFSRGGVIVQNATETLYLKDTNGDDRADERRVLFAGWTDQDTHGGASNFQYGLDNWIWGMQGYNKSSIRTGDRTVEFAQGFYRFRPDGSAFEFVRSTNNNTWGLGMSEEGIIFGSTANGCPSVYMPIPNRYYERVRGWTPQLTLDSIADSNEIHPATEKVRQMDHHGGYTAACGHALYTARSYPSTYWNRTAFICEPTGHVVSMMALSADGADFHATGAGNLLASDDEWVAPTMAEVGPDGCVWVVDWYNFIVQHNPTPAGFKTGKGAAYETDLRDKSHGRIYRIVCDAAHQPTQPDLLHASPHHLVTALANQNLFWRRHAQRLIIERGKLDVIPGLFRLLSNQATDEIGLNNDAVHALWTLHGLGTLDGNHPEVTKTVVAALHHPSAGVRRNAVAVLAQTPDASTDVLAAKMLDDTDPQVRLATLLMLADQRPTSEAGAALVQFLAKPANAPDRLLVEAATCAGATNATEFLVAATADKSPSPQLIDTCKVIANHFARAKPEADAETLLVKLAAGNPTTAAAVIAGLSEGWPVSAKFPQTDAARAAVKSLLAKLPLNEQIRLARLAARDGNEEMTKTLAGLTDGLLAKVNDDSVALKDRAAAAELIVAARPSDLETARQLLDNITPKTSPDLARAIVRALRECESPKLGELIVEHLARMSPTTQDAAMELLLSRPALAESLLAALEGGKLRLSEMSLTQKQRLSTYPNRRIRDRAQALLAKGQESVSSDRKQVLADFADLTTATGDPTKGKAAFKKSCAVCHRYQGEGAAVGPDLTGMGVHGKQQLLVHILDPSRDIEGNYQAYLVVTTDGHVLTGILTGESATSIELIDAEGKRHPILREEIDELSRTGKSLMPEGFEKQLARTDISDILEFLTQRSRFMPLDMRRAATVSTAVGMFQSPPLDFERLVFDDWGPKTFADVPFYPIDPQNGRLRNAIMLYSDMGSTPPNMPKSVQLSCGIAAKAIHMLGGVSGWGYPATKAGSVTMIVRLHYADGTVEGHSLVNGVDFADYLGQTDVKGSKLAFNLGRQQLRYLKIEPKRDTKIDTVELVKGPDHTAPVIMCVTAEQR